MDHAPGAPADNRWRTARHACANPRCKATTARNHVLCPRCGRNYLRTFGVPDSVFPLLDWDDILSDPTRIHQIAPIFQVTAVVHEGRV